MKFDCCTDKSIYTLPADTYSTAQAYVNPAGLLGTNITWSIVSTNTLGCSISATGTVTAGFQSGTVTVRATGTNCFVEGNLDLTPVGGFTGGAFGSGCSAGNCQLLGSLGWLAEDGFAEWSLGLSEDGAGAAWLVWGQEGNLLSPASLAYNYLRPDVTVINDGNGNLKQVKAPQGLMDVNSGSGHFEINIYQTNGFAWSGTNGFYVATGNPVETWSFTNGASSAILVRHTKDGVTTDFTVATNAGGGYTLTLPASAGSFRSFSSNNGRTNQVLDASSSVVYSSTTKYETVATGITRLTEQIIGTGSAAQRTAYTYTTNGWLATATYPDGNWQKFFYHTNGLVTNILSAFGTQGPTSDTSLCRSVEKYYGGSQVSGSGDDSSQEPNSPRLVIEKIKGTVISRTFHVIKATEHQVIHCLVTNAIYSEAGNLTNITRYYTSGEWFGYLKNEERPDGTMTFYEYSSVADGFLTIVIAVGEPNAGKTAVKNGTMTVTGTGPVGEMVSRTVYFVTDEVATATLGSETYSIYDLYNRPQRVDYLDGTFSWAAESCCGSEVITNRDTSVVNNRYDLYRRLVSTTFNGIATTNFYDVAGNLIKTMRIGSDASQITNRLAGFDSAGRIIAETNALGYVTAYNYATNASGQDIKTTTLPNNGTRIETYNLDGTLASISGTAANPLNYLYGTHASGTYQTEVKISDSLGTNEWIKTVYDLNGRESQVVFASSSGSPTLSKYYNSKGQLWKETDPDGIITLYTNNAKGELEIQGISMDGNGSLDSGTDRRTKWITDCVTNIDGGGTWYALRIRTIVWDDSGNDVCVATNEQALNGTITWARGFGGTTTNWTKYAGNGTRYVTNTLPDGTLQLVTYQNGLLTALLTSQSGTGQLESLSFGYDVHGRQTNVIDNRTGTITTKYYNNDDLVSSVSVKATDLDVQTTAFSYNNLGQVWITTLPNNGNGIGYVTNLYDLKGQLTNTTGRNTYPVGYIYDAQGRMQKMLTWTNYTLPNNTATTTWNYDQYRGWLSSKAYQVGNGLSYTYTAGGRLRTRVSGRNITTTYTNNAAGQIKGISYSDSTSAVNFGIDLRGRITSVTNGTSTTAITYNDAGQVLNESRDGLAVTNAYNGLLQLTAVGYSSASAAPSQYGYSGHRLVGVTNALNTAAYNYLANSPLVSDISFRTNGSLRMTASRTYDKLNRLKAISSVPSVSPSVSFTYAYNGINQRTNVLIGPDSSSWRYGYDELGQVISGKKYWSDGSPVAGQQFEFDFDDIGNRLWARMGGDTNGANLRLAVYTNNLINQITSRGAPGTNDIIGLAYASGTVTVNGQTPSRKGEYYHREISANNSASATNLWVTNLAVLNGSTQTVVGRVFQHQNGESLNYDADGNLTSDSRFSNYWDAENRLYRAVGATPSDLKFLVYSTYDFMNRRTSKCVSNWVGSTWVMESQRSFLYQGWNLVTELDGSNNLLRTHIWGTDASGTMEGAGGVGGLLATIIHTGTNAGTYFPAYDGNWNVIKYISASNGVVVAEYEYGPFHELIRASGSMAKDFNYLAATKYYDWETGWYYYGYRYYNPSTGRWLSRDPIEELGGVNLYGFVLNDPLNLVDVAGLGWIQKIKAICKSAEKAKLLAEMAERLKQLEKSSKNLAKRAAEHKQKLQEYLANPEKYDNLGVLKNAQTPEIRQKIIDGRRRKLEHDIGEFEKQSVAAEKEILEIKSAQAVAASCACSILTPHTQELTDLQKKGNNITTGQIVSGVALDIGSAIDPGILDLIEWLSE